MRRTFLVSLTIIFIISLIFLLVKSSRLTAQVGSGTRAEYVPNEVLVRFKKDVDNYFIRDAINSIQGKIISNLKDEISPTAWDPANVSHKSFRLDPHLFHVKVPEYIGTEQAIYYLKLNPNVEHVEENVVLYLDEAPNDYYFDLQWGLHNVGSQGPAHGTEDADIDAPEAWDIFTGSEDIVVAVIDTGAYFYHPDLYDNIWINWNEVPLNGQDDDNNGYIDDVYGWDFGESDNMPFDAIGHGTHVAGIIGAQGNNDIGITGVNWDVSIMVCKIFTDDGQADAATAIRAIDYSTENGAHLSNNSYGWPEGHPGIEGQYQALKNAIQRAMNWNEGSGGKLFIVSAGNTGNNMLKYPAKYHLENMIVVLSTDHNDELSSFSSWHPTLVDLGAPGGFDIPLNADDIYSTHHLAPPWDYAYKCGTSMAAPHVAGVAALIWGYPVKIWWDQVKDTILDNVDPIPELKPICVTGGRLNAYNPFTVSPPSAISNLNGWPTAWTEIKLNWQDNSNNEIGFEIQRKKSGENDYSTIDAVKANNTHYTDNDVAGGTVYYRVRSYNLGGSSSFSYKTVVIPSGPPDAPAYLEAELIGWDEVALWWDDESNNEQGFQIYRKTQYGSWRRIDSIPPNSMDYEDLDPPTGWVYYKVRAYNPYGGAYSNVASVYVEPWESQKEKPKSEKNQ